MLKLKYVIRLGRINKIPKFQNRPSIAATSSKNWSFILLAILYIGYIYKGIAQNQPC
jgi:hypothetical protein